MIRRKKKEKESEEKDEKKKCKISVSEQNKLDADALVELAKEFQHKANCEISAKTREAMSDIMLETIIILKKLKRAYELTVNP